MGKHGVQEVLIGVVSHCNGFVSAEAFWEDYKYSTWPVGGTVAEIHLHLEGWWALMLRDGFFFRQLKSGLWSVHSVKASIYDGMGVHKCIICECTINAERYLQVLEQHMLPRRQSLPQGRACIFQQDDAEPHSAQISTAGLHRKRVQVLNWTGVHILNGHIISQKKQKNFSFNIWSFVFVLSFIKYFITFCFYVHFTKQPNFYGNWVVQLTTWVVCCLKLSYTTQSEVVFKNGYEAL